MIKVLHPGIYCSVQDQGRLGLAQKGIPQGGALDGYAAEMANALLQNDPNDAVLEITFGQGKFEFTSDTMICLTGGDFSPKIDNKPIEMQAVYKVKKGAVVSFGKRKDGARTYLAVQGGIQSKMILGSRSFLAGITQVRLEKGDELEILGQNLYETGHARIKRLETYFSSPNLECFHGPEFDQLNDQQKKQLEQAFTISEDNNRVGYRLNEVLENKLSAILTSSVLPGTVQLTPSGKLIILMRDCQVTGGYPRVLQLSESAISKLGQKVAGDEVLFSLEI